MKRGSWGRDADALYRESRHGAITVARLGELGVPSRTVYRRCVPGGPWQRPLPGVVHLSSGALTRTQLVEAALLYGGPDAIVTGAESCRRQGLTRLPENDPTVHLLVPDHRKIKSSDYVLIERTYRLPEPIRRDDLPLAPLHRSVLDLCRRLRAFDPVTALLAEAVQRGRLGIEQLWAELERGCQRGTAVPREVLKDVLAGARSVAESDAMRVWERTGLPTPVWNVDLFDGDGGYVARPDCWCDEVGLAWEIDSYDFHFARTDYARTIQRNARYAAAGVVLVQTLPSRLRTEPDEVAKELRAAYQAAQNRPRPNIRGSAPRESRE